MKVRLLFVLCFLAAPWLFAQTPEIRLEAGLRISQSCRIVPGNYTIAVQTDTATGIRISGENIVVDFQQAELQGAAKGVWPHLFSGRAVVVSGKNITLKNLRAKGYKIAVYAEGVDSLTLENCDLSYNYRPRLRSIREREDFSDWLSYHHNENDEWLRYGAGIYLKNCRRSVVRNCRITGCQNALLMTACNDSRVYNNFFTFNSGLGIGLYRSSRNQLMHNRLDWNVRGYSHGFYARGQDSAGILLYEQSSNNLIAYNSATHCGDGLFLWAGQTTMDRGEGGCNDNFIFGNDFSFAPTNGVEVTFSRNRIQGNAIMGCTYGIWGGYSFETVIMGNFIADCKTAIAIEHGQNDTIQRNAIQNDSTGIQLWARETQPADWGYAQKRDTRSRDILIDRNVFLDTRKPLKISRSENVSVNGQNLFYGFDNLLEVAHPNQNFKFWRNDVYASETELNQVWAAPELAPFKNLNFQYPDWPKEPYAILEIPYGELHEPDSLPDGMLAVLPPGFPRGRQFILVDEWGPFDFRRPIAALDTAAENWYSLVLIGPSGDWKVSRMEGVKSISSRKGQVPATLTIERDPKSDHVHVAFEYSSPQSIKNVFGESYPPGTVYNFDFQRFEKRADWQIAFFHYDSIPDAGIFTRQKPIHTLQKNELAFAWWGSPAKEVREDRFATLATTSLELAPDTYLIELSSDDGARLYVDDHLLIDHWDIHEPATDEIELKLGGRHRLRIEHFDAGGFATLDFRLRVKR
ncbi:MAG: right-handed parallel beta-helix repeat-containing protein [Saprospiraceae bacterium]|nr:right-handed parallel beta-helix repeat-containing protein [Saprospiraceae bacterium]